MRLFQEWRARMRLKNKVAVVTGGGRGIGKAICQVLSREGSTVVVADVDIESARKVSGELSKLGQRSLAIEVDVSSSQQVSEMIKCVIQELGTVDILVNNAGIRGMGKIEEMSEEDWDRVIAVNLKGTFLCSKAVIPAMRKKKTGRIINIASVAGKTGGVIAGANYAVSKAGIICLTKSLAKELAPYGITVNAIAPGMIKTHMTEDFPENISQLIPLGKKGLAQDVANAVLFLASSDADYITGEILDVNGGMFMD